jgi:hypothetical protein
LLLENWPASGPDRSAANRENDVLMFDRALLLQLFLQPETTDFNFYKLIRKPSISIEVDHLDGNQDVCEAYRNELCFNKTFSAIFR